MPPHRIGNQEHPLLNCQTQTDNHAADRRLTKRKRAIGPATILHARVGAELPSAPNLHSSTA